MWPDIESRFEPSLHRSTAASASPARIDLQFPRKQPVCQASQLSVFEVALPDVPGMWTLTLLTGLGWGEHVFSLSDRMESAESLPQLWRPACLESQPSSQSLSLPLVLGRLEPCRCSLQIVGKRALWLSDKHPLQMQAIMGGSNSVDQGPTGDHHEVAEGCSFTTTYL